PAMGDMKTPDFDDLLAAFDIPDIDANEAIHSHHEDAEPHHGKGGEAGAAPAEPVLPHPDISAVSVIVKNTVCPEQPESAEGRGKDGHGAGPRLLHNGFGAAADAARSPNARAAEAPPNGECWGKEKNSKALDLFSHFSPEPGEDGANLIDRSRECKAKEKSLAVPSLAPSPTPSLDCKEPLGEGAEGLDPAFPPPPFRAGAAAEGSRPVTCIKKEESDSEEAAARSGSPKGLAVGLGDGPLEHLKSVTVRYSAEDSPVAAWPGSDPALDGSAGNAAELKRSPGSPRESFSSPGIHVPASPKQLESLSLKEEREMLEKSVGSPPSVSSGEEEEEEEDEEEEEEEESTNSPSSSSSRPLKVRIKTIKTSCGSITRTVTRVSSDSEPPSGKQNSQESPERSGGIPAEAPKDRAELASPVRGAEGPKVVSVQLGNGAKLKGTVLPVAAIQSASSAMLIAASVAQQKSAALPGKGGKSFSMQDPCVPSRVIPLLSAGMHTRGIPLPAPAQLGAGIPRIPGIPGPHPLFQVCSACPMMLPNRCSWAAHQRMHRSRPPHVCPECGGNFLLANFQSHLRDSCLHFSRRVGYRCPSCSVVFGGVNSIKSHIQSSHCEVFHKCPICPMAFKSAPSAHAHVYTQHPGFSNQQSKMIYKCAMCDTVFTHKPLLSSHFEQHLLPQRVSVFRCPHCPLLFAQKRTMLEHLKNTHQPQKSKEDSSKKSPALLTPKPEPLETPVSKISEESSSSTEEEEPPSSPELRKTKRSRFQRKSGNKSKGSGWTCGVCHSWFPERDEYVSHMKKEHGKSVKKFPCHLCERSFCSAPSLRRHVRVNHEGIKRVYPCRCRPSREPGNRPWLGKNQRDRGVGSAGNWDGVGRVPGVLAMPVSGRKRKLSSDDSCSEEPDSTTPPAKSPKSLGKAPFRCRKCGFLAGSRAEFQAHIPQHRTDGSSQQCRECGLCFTSQGSLGRHRFISHKKRKGAAEPEDSGSASQGGAGNGNSGGGAEGSEGKLECKVCGRGFESQLSLKTHFRTHGMAFIRARQSEEN
ncbi:ZN687 protein, partial [Pteruthius melanotis]|nr:ZN687 protein [Pteruthius melanotis]